MSSLANDRELNTLMREFLMCCNKTENAEAKGAEYATLSAMHEQRRAAADRIEQALLARGWVPPLTIVTPVRLPETADR
ncbi:MAG: hypothetical protein JWM93_916 [Frankiales bacterium]|nr:hypothetical protein [Frankiales bacterium]